MVTRYGGLDGQISLTVALMYIFPTSMQSILECMGTDEMCVCLCVYIYIYIHTYIHTTVLDYESKCLSAVLGPALHSMNLYFGSSLPLPFNDQRFPPDSLQTVSTDTCSARCYILLLLCPFIQFQTIKSAVKLI